MVLIFGSPSGNAKYASEVHSERAGRRNSRSNRNRERCTVSIIKVIQTASGTRPDRRHKLCRRGAGMKIELRISKTTSCSLIKRRPEESDLNQPTFDRNKAGFGHCETRVTLFTQCFWLIAGTSPPISTNIRTDRIQNVLSLKRNALICHHIRLKLV